MSLLQTLITSTYKPWWWLEYLVNYLQTLMMSALKTCGWVPFPTYCLKISKSMVLAVSDLNYFALKWIRFVRNSSLNLKLFHLIWLTLFFIVTKVSSGYFFPLHSLIVTYSKRIWPKGIYNFPGWLDNNWNIIEYGEQRGKL